MKQLLRYLLLFLLSASAVPHIVFGQSQQFDPKAANYLWPTKASSYLTSTFGETRAAHFHAALDIKTWGKRGYEIYATRDGIVDRIAIGPRGYGKVVYLKHPDGSYSVYAHLLSFNDQLQQLADSVRFAEDYKFEIERFLSWKNIEVDQGDVIGYSGASGIGPPHLHFELRTPSHKPYNPLLTNLEVKDNIPPQIRGLSIEPLSARSSINGDNKIYVQNSWGKKDNYDFGTITTSGPVGLGINVFDQSNGVNNSYAVHELQMSIDGREVFKSRVDSFSYNETDQMFLDRVYPILEESDTGYQRLYITDGNTLPFYSTTDTKGVLDLEPGTHSVTIRATDFYGNSTTASVQLNVQIPDTQRPNLSDNQNGDSRSSEFNSWNWFCNWVTIPDSQFGNVNIAADREKFIQHNNGTAVKLDKLDNLFINTPDLGPTILRRITPNKLHFIPSVNQRHFAMLPAETTYDTISVGMRAQTFHPDSIAVEMVPRSFPLRNNYKFYIRRDSALTDTTKKSFYLFDHEDQEWDLVPTTFQKQYIVAAPESLGQFTLQQDTTAPRLFNPRLRQRPDGQWLIMIDVRDNLSGIDHSQTIIFVNGVQGIAEYEPEDDRFVYYHPEFTPSNSMTIKITAVDKMGNKRTTTFELGDEHTKR
jgi:hypothetical protein